MHDFNLESCLAKMKRANQGQMALLPIKDDNKLVNIKFQYITLLVIICCIAVFLWQISLGSEQQNIIYSFGTIPSVFLGANQLDKTLINIPPSLTLITCLFLHGGWIHLIFNMLFLWVFGDNIEDALGHVKFLCFYLICGLLASLTHIFIESNSIRPLIGASGAVSGVLGAYIVLHPKAQILVLVMNIIPLRLPAILVLGTWIIIQFLNIGADNNTAWWAHIGGFVSGVLLISQFHKRNQFSDFYEPDRLKEQNNTSGNITTVERFQKIIDIWNNANNNL